ncbi:hypothetical protein KCU61_g7361, partial [Aureobasidium melanogenum]
MDVDSLPVGSILAYPVDALDSAISPYWRLCQGSAMSKTQYPELFDAIGYCNGSSIGDPDVFYLPNFQGCFLRGVDDSGQVDKDKDSRISANGQKAQQLAGSIQGSATARPSGLALSIPFLPHGLHHINHDAGPLAYMMMEYNPGFDDFALQFPNQETVPVNMYMQYIIKIKPSAAIPVGGIISYAGQASQAPDPEDHLWVPCEGAHYRTSSRAFKDLFNLLSTRYGLSVDGSEFYLPDLQGLFIRGVDINTGRDKNGNRNQPPGFKGRPGSVAGSTQAFGTAQANNPLTARLWHIGHGATDEVLEVAGYYNVRGDNNTSEQHWSGGDSETRPVNAYVQFLMAIQGDVDTEDMVPVGTVIGIPGEKAPNAAYWKLCDGSYITRAEFPQYAQVCGSIWGASDKDHVCLPDLRGMFLRGVDNNISGPGGVDPDRLQRRPPRPRLSTPGQSTGIGSIQDAATSTVDVHVNISLPTRHWMNAATAVGDNAESYDSELTPCDISGGDTETRPINIAVRYYIKVTAVGVTNPNLKALPTSIQHTLAKL